MSAVPQHKRLAMGEKVGFKKGGSVGGHVGGPLPPKSGMKATPLETAKRKNGITGMKKGGSACGCD